MNLFQTQLFNDSFDDSVDNEVSFIVSGVDNLSEIYVFDLKSWVVIIMVKYKEVNIMIKLIV